MPTNTALPVSTNQATGLQNRLEGISKINSKITCILPKGGGGKGDIVTVSRKVRLRVGPRDGMMPILLASVAATFRPVVCNSWTAIRK